jgi:hypothetical protein
LATGKRGVVTKGVAFRRLVLDSLKGTHGDERPDTILIDDIDTDEECRNAQQIKDHKMD